MTLRRLSARRHTPFGWVEIPSKPIWWRRAPWGSILLIWLSGFAIGFNIARLWP
jgi:hypothetical protein